MDLGAPHAGGGEEGVDLRAHLVDPGRVDLVDLAHHRDALAHPEQVEDRGVLAGLGHHAVVGRHHHQREVDGPHPRQHVAHEPLVPGDVDEAEHVIRIERVVREPEVDGEPPLLLLGEAIGVDPGERTHQRGLAVVDVAGGGDDHGVAGRSGRARSPAAASGKRRLRRSRADDTGPRVKRRSPVRMVQAAVTTCSGGRAGR